MRITRKLGLAYALLASVSLGLVAWLGIHEFVTEPVEFARRGLTDIHKNTWPELSVVLFFGFMPVLLALGWWWMRRVLTPLNQVAKTLEAMDVQKMQTPLPRTMNGDEVDKFCEVFNAMILRLNASMRQIHTFSLSTSHELKTPLTVMRAQLEMALKEAGEKASPRPPWIESQLNEVLRMSSILESLMLLTKENIGHQAIDCSEVGLNELVREAALDVEILGSTKQLEVEVSVREEILVKGDQQRLRQLLLILSENAVKYSRPGGRISFSLSCIEKEAELRISNTICDNITENLEDLFDPFIRGNNSSHHPEGCGLGLPIARWIVERHQGSIQLNAEDQGSITVIVRLPVLPCQISEVGK